MSVNPFVHPLTDRQRSLLEYLDVDPLRDYWYATDHTGVWIWVVYRADGRSYEKPVREEDMQKEDQE